jgi:hypothetical protein
MQVGALRCLGVQLRIKVQDLKGFQVLGKWNCQPVFKFFPKAVSFLPHFAEIMAQSARAAGKSKEREECHC